MFSLLQATNDLNLSLIEKIANAPWYFFGLIAMIFLPVAVNLWFNLLTTIGILNRSRQKFLVFIIVSLFFVGSLIMLKIGNDHIVKMKIAEKRIYSFMTYWKWDFIPYDTVRAKINSKYSDKFLEEIIENSNGLFVRNNVQGQPNSYGIVLQAKADTTHH